MFVNKLLLIVLTTFAGSGLVSQWILPTTSASPSPAADSVNNVAFVGGGGGIGGSGKISSYYLRDMSVLSAANTSGRKFCHCHLIEF